uniref:Peptidase domain containing associated with muscle reration 1 n=1 Tax=Sinocyclocheilus grahami TaxID=75366 RepID=A0A672LCI1_SINGR
MCRTCCEYLQISCKCPSQGTKVGYAVPCCRNALDECDPCILHQGCSIFDNCKTCNNGTWLAKDDFYIRGRYCTSCRRGWSGGDCLTCGEVIQRPHGHVTLESYPINAKCEWTLQVGKGATMELRVSMISLESDHSCRYDYVEVRDGDSLTSPVIGRYCGDESPSPIRSSGNSLHIHFVSDGYNNDDGFFATFQEVSGTKSINIEYFCNNTYILSGDSKRTCQKNGTWSGSQPLCVRACREPKVSKLVRQKVLKYQPPSRKSPVHKLYSASIQRGTEADTLEKAFPVFGDLPPTFHHVYTSIEYECVSALYKHSGSTHRTCLKTGKWSGRHFSCSPVCGKLPSASPQNFTEVHWPWHAALYIRLYNSSPLMKDQRWQLVCSGALVNQHWVVVAAHCVVEPGRTEALSSDDLNVVMGKHYLSDLRENKRLQDIQIAQILIHPDYDPYVLDSDLAMLKLVDKARISEYVSPVCLPYRQGGEVIAKQAFLTGWPVAGQHRAHTDSEATRTGLIELADVVKCERQFSKHNVPISITDNMLCGRQHPLSLRAEDTDSHHAWELLGLVSFRYDLQGCNPDLYTVHTRVSNFKNWIETNIT